MKQPVANTRQRILDAAEELYGLHGVGATSLRAIVKAARVNLNAVNYHFGSKDLVTEQLFKNIMTPINEERSVLLAKLIDDSATVRQLMHAIYWPLFRRAVESEDSRRQIIIVNQIRQDPSQYAREMVAANLDEFAPQFESKLARATKLSQQKLFVPIRFMIASAWGLVTQSIVIDELAFQRSRRIQTRVFEQFLDYATAGFDKLVA